MTFQGFFNFKLDPFVFNEHERVLRPVLCIRDSVFVEFSICCLVTWRIDKSTMVVANTMTSRNNNQRTLSNEYVTQTRPLFKCILDGQGGLIEVKQGP